MALPKTWYWAARDPLDTIARDPLARISSPKAPARAGNIAPITVSQPDSLTRRAFLSALSSSVIKPVIQAKPPLPIPTSLSARVGRNLPMGQPSSASPAPSPQPSSSVPFTAILPASTPMPCSSSSMQFRSQVAPPDYVCSKRSVQQQSARARDPSTQVEQALSPRDLTRNSQMFNGAGKVGRKGHVIRPVRPRGGHREGKGGAQEMGF